MSRRLPTLNWLTSQPFHVAVSVLEVRIAQLERAQAGALTAAGRRNLGSAIRRAKARLREIGGGE